MASSSSRPAAPEPADAVRLSVEELARRSGTTVSNLRALQARGLLDPPELEGRKGFYSRRHLARVALLRRLQDRGYSLAAIADLIEGWQRGAGLMDVLGLEDAVSGPHAPARVIDVEQELPALAQDPSLLQRALAAELLVREGDRIVAPSPELIDGFSDYLAAGFPPGELLDELGWLAAETERIAARFRGSFQRHVVAPFIAEGAPAKKLGELSEKVERLRARSIRATTLLLGRAIERGGTLSTSRAESAPRKRGRSPKKKK